MRSRISLPRSLAIAFFALMASVLWSARASTLDAAPGAQRPTDEQVSAALDKVKADPNISGERTAHTLKWKKNPNEPDKVDWAWIRWIGRLFNWLAETSRLLFWVVVGLVVALLAVFLLRVMKNFRGPGIERMHHVAPTHVRDLDIRPESLPDDIGAAALLLWEKGEHRAALALLYRGLLSRLAHVHAVPIKHSTTEADCIELCAPRLASGGIDYVSQLVRVWQRAVYGGQDPADQDMQSLCSAFATALRPAATANTLPAT